MVSAGNHRGSVRAGAGLLLQQVQGIADIFLRGGGLFLLAQPSGVDAVFRQPVVHTLGLGDVLPVALTAGEHRDGLGVFLQIGLRRLQTLPEGFAGRCAVDAGAQDDHIVRPGILRAVTGRGDPDAGDHRRQHNQAHGCPENMADNGHGDGKHQTQAVHQAEHQHHRRAGHQQQAGKGKRIKNKVQKRPQPAQDQGLQPIFPLHQNRYPFRTSRVLRTPSTWLRS